MAGLGFASPQNVPWDGMGWGQGPVRAQPDPPVVSSSEGGAGFAEPGELSAAHPTTGFSNTERVKCSTAARRG